LGDYTNSDMNAGTLRTYPATKQFLVVGMLLCLSALSLPRWWEHVWFRPNKHWKITLRSSLTLSCDDRSLSRVYRDRTAWGGRRATITKRLEPRSETSPVKQSPRGSVCRWDAKDTSTLNLNTKDGIRATPETYPWACYWCRERHDRFYAVFWRHTWNSSIHCFV